MSVLRYVVVGGWCFLCIFAAVACSGGDSKKAFAEACGADSECESNLCARESSIKGHCSKACSDANTEICANTFGSLAYCNIDDLCALKCDSGACPGDLFCNTDVIPDTCYAR
jgi:hypothetical protein